MTQTGTNTEQEADRIRLSLKFDAKRMLDEVKALHLKDFIYYDSVPLTIPFRKVDVTGKIDFADGSWADWHDATILKESEYLSNIVNYFRQKTSVTLVRLLRLEPGAVIKEHTDPTLGLHIPNSVIRLTIPILANDGVEFLLNGIPVDMRPGECWYLRLTDPHKVSNLSLTERVNMTIDMNPNEWVRSLIVNGKSTK